MRECSSHSRPHQRLIRNRGYALRRLPREVAETKDAGLGLGKTRRVVVGRTGPPRGRSPAIYCWVGGIKKDGVKQALLWGKIVVKCAPPLMYSNNLSPAELIPFARVPGFPGIRGPRSLGLPDPWYPGTPRDPASWIPGEPEIPGSPRTPGFPDSLECLRISQQARAGAQVEGFPLPCPAPQPSPLCEGQKRGWGGARGRGGVLVSFFFGFFLGPLAKGQLAQALAQAPSPLDDL